MCENCSYPTYDWRFVETGATTGCIGAHIAVTGAGITGIVVGTDTELACTGTDTENEEVSGTNGPCTDTAALAGIDITEDPGTATEEDAGVENGPFRDTAVDTATARQTGASSMTGTLFGMPPATTGNSSGTFVPTGISTTVLLVTDACASFEAVAAGIEDKNNGSFALNLCGGCNSETGRC